jgi:hypothetical protein
MTAITDQILDTFPSGSYALTALLRLLDIVESPAVPTAAVECRVQPRMLINPDFVKRHAASPEKLLMLVMHELHHVLLGHTTLFPRLTRVDNFIFDAVINGLLCRMFPDPQYTAFFTDYYGTDFPEFLLRPPASWPGTYVAPEGIRAIADPKHRAAIIALHQGLYSDAGASYEEIRNVLRIHDSGEGDMELWAPLIGDHSAHGSADGALEERSPVLFDIVREIVEEWPQPPDPIQGRSLDEIITESMVVARRQPSARAVLRRLISLVASKGRYGRRRMHSHRAYGIEQPLPTHDRRAAVQRVLGHTPLLYRSTVSVPRVIPAGDRVHVYLDVSGSVAPIIASLYGAILQCRDSVHPTVHLFSTVIADVSLAELKRGVCRSTGGTSVVCIAEHMAAHDIRRALIVTDGYTGVPTGEHSHTLSRAQIAVAYIDEIGCGSDLAAVANHSAFLPLGVEA